MGEELWIDLCGRVLPAKNTKEGIRAVVKDRPITPEEVWRYLQAKFGGHLEAATDAMQRLAKSRQPATLAVEAFSLYEQFRPEIVSGKAGWGQKGKLDLGQIALLARRK